MKQTHYMFKDILKVSTLVDSILEKRGFSNCIFAEIYNYMDFQHTLTWRFGSPNAELYLFTPNRQYLDKTNPFLNQWRDCVVDPGITDIFRTKYSQGERLMELPDRYNLFVMQDGIENEHEHMMDAMNYAREQKVYTIFKQHPLTKICIQNSDYIIFADASYNLDHLLNHADRVSSSWSTVSLNAMLKGIPCATYDTMTFSEIVPIIKTARELENIQPVDYGDLQRFLSWYVHKLCIDVSKEGFEERIEQRIVDFK